MKFAPSLLVAIVFAVATSADAQSYSSGVTKSKAVSKPSPMVFYLAKGGPNECGEGCSEWIAAEGQIAADTAQRLRSLLTRVGKRKLPIFFHSSGGDGTTAVAMGRLLREREMTAGVSKTDPVGCVGASEQTCRALKQSGEVLPSELSNVAGCNSACVFVLIGAKVRQVPPGARLGVHSVRLVMRRTDGRAINPSDKRFASFQKAMMAGLNVRYRRYIQEMRVDPRLYDLLSKVPHEKVHYLSRDEIVRFGIDTREFHEARWIATELLPKQLWTMKYFVEAKGEDRKELRTSLIRLECASPQRIKVAYFRNLGTLESEAKRSIKLAIGDRGALLSVAGSAFKMEAIEGGAWFNLWGTHAPFEFFEAAAAHETVEIVESESADTPTRITKLSTAGLSQAIAKLSGRCSGTPDCRPSETWVAGALSPNCQVPFRNVR